MATNTTIPKQTFGLIIIGDEILFGNREDSHFDYFRALLSKRGLHLARCYLLADEIDGLTRHLRLSMTEALPVFVCGGIGATPDDVTRISAANAADLPLVRHPEATALIEGRFGNKAYPTRIHMADLPEGCGLIPNPYNQIPGFYLREHYFLPGFPQMAWPMAEWVLEQFYPYPNGQGLGERSLKVVETPESSLVPIMEKLSEQYSELKLFSLPHMGDDPHIELGFRGEHDLDKAIQALASALRERDIPFEELAS